MRNRLEEVFAVTFSVLVPASALRSSGQPVGNVRLAGIAAEILEWSIRYAIGLCAARERIAEKHAQSERGENKR